jgi:DNA-binding response OmpR family regulator
MAETTADLILLVDDDATGRSIRKVVLEMNGHRVVDAGEVPLALRTLASESVRLVILDYFLNDTTGVELAKQMRQVKPEVPILLLSASGDVPEGTEYADAYLSKMEPVAVVEQTILALLRQGRRHTT